MTKKMWQFMPREKQKTVMLVYEPMTEEEIQDLEEWYEEIWLAMEHDWIQEWKERGRMRPFTAEGIESRHDMPTYATKPAENRRAQWQKERAATQTRHTRKGLLSHSSKLNKKIH